MRAADPFLVEDPASGESFVVFGDVGWLSFIAGWTRFPEPRRERDGYSVLEPATGETLTSLRAGMSHGIIDFGSGGGGASA